MNSKSYIKIGALIATSSISLIVGFKISPELSEFLIRTLGYWFIALITGFALYAYRQKLGLSRDFPKYLQKNCRPLLICLALTAFLVSREESEFKILYDEPALASTAIGMHLHRQPIIEQPSHGNDSSLSYVDKRPLFFPFLVSIAHDILGFNPKHSIYLNYGITFVLLVVFLKVCLLLSKQNTRASYCALMIFCSAPLIAQNSSSGSFELLNLVLILATLLASYKYSTSRNSQNLNTLLASTLLLAHTRYESSIFVISTACLILTFSIRDKKTPVTYLLILCPLLLLPIAWQNNYSQNNSLFWQLETIDQAVFSIQYILKNLNSAFYFFFSPDGSIPSSSLYLPTCIVASLFLLSRISKRKKTSFLKNISFILIALSILANFFLLMCYHWGYIHDREAARLALPILLLAALPISPALDIFFKQKKTLSWLPAIILLFVWSESLTILNNGKYTDALIPAKRAIWQRDRILETTKSPESILVISEAMPYWIAYRINALNFERALAGAGRILYHKSRNTYDEIYVVQNHHFSRTNGSSQTIINQGQNLGPAFVLEEIERTSFLPYNLTIISVLKNIDLELIKKSGGIDSYAKIYDLPLQDIIPVSPSEFDAWEQTLP